MSTIVTRSGKGSPLTHAEVDSNFTNLNTDKLELSGGTMTGDVGHGDNVKATFGASADLQVYHDGSNSYIQDAGTGQLILRGSNSIVLNNADNSKNMVVANDGGEVSLYHNGSSKLATTSSGIDVTGTVVADGSQIDLTSVRQVNTQMATSGSGYGAITCVEPTASNLRGLELEGQLLRFGTNAFNQTTSIRRLQINDAGETIFYEDTGAYAKMRWLPTNERLRFEDSVRASFGASDDLVIYHDGTNSNIENGTGALHIRNSTAGQLKLQAVSGEQSIVATPNSSVELYYDNSKKLETLTDGVNILGTLYKNKSRSNYNISTNWEDGVSWEWIWGDTGTNSNTWYKVADLTWPTNGTYDGGSFEIEVLTNGGNFGSSVNVQHNHYLLAIHVSGAASLDTDTAYLRGKDSQNSELRVVKTASGTYELQVRALGNYRGIFIKVFANATDSSTVTPTDSLTAGSTSGTVYSPSQATSSDAFRHTFGQVEASTVRLGDNNKATFGESDDLQIYHDGSNSFISDQGTGNIKVLSNYVAIKSADDSTLGAEFLSGGKVGLRYNNTERLATTSTGVAISGSVELNGWTITESGGSLYFATGGTNKMKLDASGNLDVVGSVNSNATIT